MFQGYPFLECIRRSDFELIFVYNILLTDLVGYIELHSLSSLYVRVYKIRNALLLFISLHCTNCDIRTYICIIDDHGRVEVEFLCV